MKWTLLIEFGWFGALPRYEGGFLPSISLWVVRVSWIRGHVLAALRDALRKWR